MEPKDVMHFYLGCEVMIDNFPNPVVCKIINISHGSLYASGTTADGKIFNYYGNSEKVKLILRPLSSMTEADCPDWFKTWMPNGFDVHWQVSNSHGYIEVDSRADDGYLLTISQDGSMNCECKDNGEQYEYRGAELFAHLLSRGFDLFGLIKSGKAIDATSLTEPLK